MKFRIDHTNLNVLDLEKSLAFYQEALGLAEMKRHEAADGSFTIVFVGDGSSAHLLELTWLRERKEPYELGDNETHLAFKVNDFGAAYRLHQKMGCICYENKNMGVYFINDPDGYWLEIVAEK